MSYLVLFDINGVLGCDIPFNLREEGKRFTFRDGLLEMLQRLSSEGIVVGIFSSKFEKNVREILSPLEFRFEMILGASHCTLDPDYPREDLAEYSTVKLLSRVWENPVFNRKREWNSSNTLLVDNSPEKIRFNSEQNVLLVETCSYDETWKDIGSLEASIRLSLENMY